MVEQATFLLHKLEFENMVMSMLIINPVHEPHEALRHGAGEIVSMSHFSVIQTWSPSLTQKPVQRLTKRLVCGCENFLLPLLNCSAWPCLAWVLLSKAYKPFSSPL